MILIFLIMAFLVLLVLNKLFHLGSVLDQEKYVHPLSINFYCLSYFPKFWADIVFNRYPYFNPLY
jgi:hypothetical protein